MCYTPAWQEKYTGIHRDTLLRFAREWAVNAEKTNGKNMIIIGAGANHWYHNNLFYRSAITALMLTGCVGVNGGGLAHYVGQEKLVSQASWGAIAFAGDWGYAPRQQNTPSFHYVHSDQWRYERGFTAYESLPENQRTKNIPSITRCGRCGAAGCHFSRSSTATHWKWSERQKQPVRKSEAEIIQYVVHQLKAERCNLRWKTLTLRKTGRGCGSSGAEMQSAQAPRVMNIFCKHYLGTHSNAIAPEMAKGYISEVEYHAASPDRQAGPGCRSEFPHGHFGFVFRYCAACCHLV